MLWGLVVLALLSLTRRTSAADAKSVIHDTNLQNICQLAANLAAAGAHLGGKIQSLQNEIAAEEKIRKTALVLAGAKTRHNLTVRLADAYAAIKMVKNTALLARAAAAATTAASQAGTAAGAIREAFSLLEQHTKTGSTSSAESVCLTNNQDQAAGGSNLKRNSPGRIAKCFTLSGGHEGATDDPFNIQKLLPAAKVDTALFTNGAAGAAGAGCPITNIETRSFGKAAAGLTTLKLAAELIQLDAARALDHSTSKLLSYQDVKTQAPAVFTAVQAYREAVKTIEEYEAQAPGKIANLGWETVRTDNDFLQALKNEGAVPPQAKAVPSGLQDVYDEYIQKRKQWATAISNGNQIEEDWRNYLAARSNWLAEAIQRAETQPTCTSVAGKTGDACNAIGDSNPEKCNETDNCHFVENNEKGRKCTLKKEVKEKLEKANQESEGKTGNTNTTGSNSFVIKTSPLWLALLLF
uniref:Variant surface glycoprotein 1125.30 n=1 Tax=Trypanosoma brucei TaxID=5691 RepID=A0A1J0R426_9TRYP|nr:variant surface glycoprotein 1125.30 [Trypanosoma brucei]